MENNQDTYVLGALAKIEKKVDLMNANIQDVKIDLIHVQEDIDEARADISELKQYNSLAIMNHIEEEELNDFLNDDEGSRI